MEYARQTRRRRKRWPIGLTILIDVLLTGACLVVFALFDHVLPKAKISVPPMLLPKLSGNPHRHRQQLSERQPERHRHPL